MPSGMEDISEPGQKLIYEESTTPTPPVEESTTPAPPVQQTPVSPVSPARRVMQAAMQKLKQQYQLMKRKYQEQEDEMREEIQKERQASNKLTLAKFARESTNKKKASKTDDTETSHPNCNRKKVKHRKTDESETETEDSSVGSFPVGDDDFEVDLERDGYGDCGDDNDALEA